jgi:hypothetical protein
VNSIQFQKIKILKTNQKNVFELQNIENIKLIEVFSINGQKIKSMTNNQNNAVFLSMEECQSGIYLLVFHDDFEQKKVYKINL